MKKLVSFILCIVFISSVMTVLPINGSAEEAGLVLPEFDIPMFSYQTFAETKIPHEEILSCFPETVEIKYEDGVMLMKDIGADEVYCVDCIEGNFNDGELVQGYWRFEMTAEEYASEGYIVVGDDYFGWQVEYGFDGVRGMVYVPLDGDTYKCIQLYPTEGYGEQYYQVTYELGGDLRVSDTYEGGALAEQTVSLENSVESIWADYSPQGELEDIAVSVYETDEYAYYLPGKGWSEDSGEYVPVNAPKGHENDTLETLLARVPTDIGCEHSWSESTCDFPNTCSHCKRVKGEPKGHKWVTGKDYDTCNDCNGIRYRVGEMAAPSFADRPYYELDKSGIDVDAILSAFPRKLDVSYENGMLMFPNIGTLRFNAYGGEDVPMDGWNAVKVNEDELGDVDINYGMDVKNGDDRIWYDFGYLPDGTLKYVSIYHYDADRSIYINLAKNTVTLSYMTAEAERVEYTDTYKNGVLTSQRINDRENGVKVYYGSELEIKKVTVFVNGEYYRLTPEAGWTTDVDGGSAVPTPEGYENKDIGYFKETYPTNIDFCIHDWKEIKNGKECVKCGEKDATESNTVLIVTVSACTVAVVAAVVIVVVVIKKKKR